MEDMSQALEVITKLSYVCARKNFNFASAVSKLIPDVKPELAHSERLAPDTY
jgi:hypothetical protein